MPAHSFRGLLFETYYVLCCLLGAGAPTEVSKVGLALADKELKMCWGKRKTQRTT